MVLDFLARLLLLATVIVADSGGSECFWADSRNSEDSSSAGASTGSEKRLVCRVASLVNRPQALPQVDSAESLLVECSGVPEGSLLTGSIIRPNQFRSLPNLRELTLEHCAMQIIPSGAFAGLSGLQRLQILGDGGDESAADAGGASSPSGQSPPSLQPDTFRQLSGLASLDLTGNGIASLPRGTFCHVANLRSLNLSLNSIRQLTDIGLSQDESADQCQLLQLEELDLSNNQLTALLPRDLGLVPSLQKLILKANRISVMSDLSLSGLWSLSLLDLSHNQLSSLPTAIFHQSPSLQKIFLQNNSLTLLADNQLQGLENLLLLNLSHNSLSSDFLSELTFAGQPKLVALDLSFNHLKTIKGGLLGSLHSLQILNLQHNAIAELEQHSLDALRNLHILMLSENLLSSLPEEVLSPLSSLSSLSLDHNKLTSLPPALFTNCLNLQDLALNNNLLEKIPEALSSLANLRTLDLGENRLAEVDNSQVAGLANLYGLRLAGNRLTRIPGEMFTKNANLHVLNLAHNRLTSVEPEAMKNLKNLRALRLDNNQLKDMNGLVSSLKNLKWLNVSTNSLQWFDFAFIPKSLEWLDIHNNRIDKIGNYYRLSTDFSLATLDMSFNSVRQIEEGTFLASLRHIYLNNNRLAGLNGSVFGGLANLSRVELQGNELTHLDIEALATAKTDTVPEFLLGGNPWICDCQMEWMKDINRLALTHNYGRIIDIESVMCTTAKARNNTSLAPHHTPLLLLDSEQFMCAYEAHCIPQCFCCDFFACDCRMQCPEGCICYHDNAWTNNVIQCSGGDFTDVPPLIPMDATTVYLDGNNMTELVNPGFIGRKRVHTIYLNNSLVQHVTNFSFEGLTSLRVLHLENNRIERLDGTEFVGLERLKELYLQNNLLVSIAGETFENLRSLAVLRLDGNLLVNFPVWELSKNSLLVGLYLSGNLWTCDCDFLNPFLVYQWKSGSKIVDKNGLRCLQDPLRTTASSAGAAATSTNAAAIPIQMNAVTCSESDGDVKTVQSTLTSIDYTPILVAVFLAVLIIVIGYLVTFTFRANIKRWLYSRAGEDKGSVYSGGGGAADKLFDVFISYSSEDAAFVEQTFAASLEHGATCYRLCLHQRDFPPSTPLYDSVSVAVESSSRTLIVLSRSYLATTWPAIRTPFVNSLLSNATKVVFVQLDDLSSEELAAYSDLRHLMAESPLMRWGDAQFWARLRCQLPEPVYLTFHRNVTMRGGTLPSSANNAAAAANGGRINHYEPVSSSSATNQILLQQQNQQQQQQAAWTYFVEDSQSSLDTNTTEMSDTSHDSSTNNSTSRSPNLDHTYYSIDNNHIYHTLDPASGANNNGMISMGLLAPAAACQQHQQPPQHLHQQQPGRLYINRNLDLVDQKGRGVCLVEGGGMGHVTTRHVRHDGQLFSITPTPSFTLATAAGGGSGRKLLARGKKNNGEYVV